MTQPDPRPQTRPAPAGGAEFTNSLTNPEHFDHFIAGAVTAGAGKTTFRNNTGQTLEISSVRLTAGTAPTGAALIVDVNAAGTSVFTAGNRPKLAIGATSGSATPDAPVITVAPNALITVDVDQVGSTVAGSDLAIVVEAVRTPLGGIPWQQLRDGYDRPSVRDAELLPVDINTDAEQAAPAV